MLNAHKRKRSRFYPWQCYVNAVADVTDTVIIDKYKHGLLQGWSFGFKPLEVEIEQRNGKTPRRHVKELDLFEVSIIDDRQTPCYNGTLIECRSEDAEELSNAKKDLESIINAYYLNMVDFEQVKRAIEKADAVSYEVRYNPNHDPETGRFTTYLLGGSQGVSITDDNVEEMKPTTTVQEVSGEQEGLTNEGESGTMLAVTDCKTHDEFTQYMKDKYNINVDPSVSQCNIEALTNSMVGFEATAQEFPEIADNLQIIDTNCSARALMSTSGGILSVNPNFMTTPTSLDDKKATACASKWSAGNTGASTVSHESGHMVEWAIDSLSSKYNYEAREKWATGSEAKSIVEKAVSMVDKGTINNAMNEYKTATGKSSMRATSLNIAKALSWSTSQYPVTAGDRRKDNGLMFSETLAEAFSDCYANGSNATAFSKAIKQATTDRYNELGGKK